MITQGMPKSENKQGELSDKDFAKRLGVSRQLWALVKNGKHNPGLKFIQAVMRVYPELTVELMAYLKE